MTMTRPHLAAERESILTRSRESVSVVERRESKSLALCDGGALLNAIGDRITLTEVLRQAAQQSHKGILFHCSDGTESFRSYAAILEEAQRILAGVRRLGLEPNDKVVLQLEQACDFIPAFWGCVLGGIIPVPIPTAAAYEPTNHTVANLLNVWGRLDRPLVLTSESLELPLSALWGQSTRAVVRTATIEGLRNSKPDRNWHSPEPDDLLVLLLTSGTTSASKLVMLTHRNILSCIVGNIHLNGFSSDEVSVNWLRLTHVGAFMRSIRDIYLGCQQVQVPTHWVLGDPLRWLDLMDRYRATTSWAPNFAFSLIVGYRPRIIREKSWDLSCLKSLWSSGEQVVPRTMQSFAELLVPFGLRPDALRATWGMTEACSATASPIDLQQASGCFAEVGRPVPGISLRIVDDCDELLHEDTVGRVQIRGPTVCPGYYQSPQQNQEAFTSDGWLRTGDLGFVHEGRLTVTGRERDVIIIRGVKYSNHEIESIVETVPGVEAGFTAACSVETRDSNIEQLAIFFHPVSSDEAVIVEVVKAIRGTVARATGIAAAYIVPVARDFLPRTTSGKIQRSVLGAGLKNGDFDTISKLMDAAVRHRRLDTDSGAPRTSVEKKISAAVAEILSVKTVGSDDNFFALGGHSVHVVQLLSRLEIILPQRRLSPADIFRTPTVRGLAMLFDSEDHGPATVVVAKDRAQLRKAMTLQRQTRVQLSRQ